MRRVLLVAYLFPPIAATGSMRPLNFCRHLVFHGWIPRVLATEPRSVLPPQPTDQKLLGGLPADIQVDRVPHSDPRGRLLDLRKQVRRLFRGGQLTENAAVTGSGAPPNRADGPTGSVSSGWGRFLAEALLEFPDLQNRWYRPAVRAMAEVASSARPDVVWATGGPWTSLRVGKRLAEKWNVPFIADFRDPWLAFGGSSWPLLKRRQRVIERSIFAAAARVTLNTEEIRAYYASVYPEYRHKLITLTNGYPADLESFYAAVRSSERMSFRSRQSSSPLELCHFGTVYWKRQPTALLQAVEELVSEEKLEPGQLRLRFVGVWEQKDVHCERLAKNLEEKGMLRREPPVPHEKCLQEMAHADVLLVLQQDIPLQIPAKIYEYIVTGRPLLVIGGEGATASLVQRHRLGKCCPNTVEDIKRIITSVLTSGARLSAPDPSDTAQFNYRVLSEKLANLLNDVCGEA